MWCNIAQFNSATRNQPKYVKHISKLFGRYRSLKVVNHHANLLILSNILPDDASHTKFPPDAFGTQPGGRGTLRQAGGSASKATERVKHGNEIFLKNLKS